MLKGVMRRRRLVQAMAVLGAGAGAVVSVTAADGRGNTTDGMLSQAAHNAIANTRSRMSVAHAPEGERFSARRRGERLPEVSPSYDGPLWAAVHHPAVVRPIELERGVGLRDDRSGEVRS